MFDSTVLGVDPGVSALGLAVVTRHDRHPELRFATTVRTSAGLAEAIRLRRIHEAIRVTIAEHAPDSMAVERLAWNRNQVSALHVARATGVVLLAAAEAGLEVDEYGPLEVKKAITGQGTAAKAQVRAALVKLHGLRDVPSDPDAADAVAVALCHLSQTPLKRAARAANVRAAT